MALIKCPECGTEVSDKAIACPKCAYPIQQGIVDVSGSTVKVDSSKELDNLYQIARRAKENNNGENAAKYYDMILVKDPTSWEAAFYVVYFQATTCKIIEIQSAAISVSNCIDTVLMLIKDHVQGKDEQIKAANEVATRCISIAQMLYNGAMNHYNGINSEIKSNYTQEMIDRCCAARDICYLLGTNLENIFDYQELKPTVAEAWKAGISKHSALVRFFSDKEGNKQFISNMVEKVKKYDPGYVPPEISTGGCYVATAVYGSYDCPQVWTLRRYRDNSLAKVWYGRAFIHTYYAVSPTLVRWFGRTNWFKALWRGKLDRMVARLNAEGYEDTPYQDRDW